jgi:hypothetical protein
LEYFEFAEILAFELSIDFIFLQILIVFFEQQIVFSLIAAVLYAFIAGAPYQFGYILARTIYLLVDQLFDNCYLVAWIGGDLLANKLLIGLKWLQ